MVIVKVTEKDTKPITCNAGKDITGYSYKLQVAMPVPLEKDAVITDSATGIFIFNLVEADKPPGRFEAGILITDPAGETETTDKFWLDIAGRPV